MFTFSSNLLVSPTEKSYVPEVSLRQLYNLYKNDNPIASHDPVQTLHKYLRFTYVSSHMYQIIFEYFTPVFFIGV